MKDIELVKNDSDVWESEQNSSDSLQMDFFPADDNKSMLVYKRNELIHAKFALSAFSQKVMAALISRINPLNKTLPPFQFSMSEFAHMLGVSRQRAYSVIDEVTDELQSKFVRIAPRNREHEERVLKEKLAANEEGRTVQFIPKPIVGEEDFEKINWFHKSTYKSKDGLVTFIFHDDMRDYLVDFSSNFTPYSLSHILGMKSSYSIRFYEIMRSFLSLSYVQKGQTEIFKTLNYTDLRDILGIQPKQYERFYDFEKKVLLQAQNELDKSDLTFKYFFPERKLKARAKVTRIKFLIKSKKLNLSGGSSLSKWLSPKAIESLVKKYSLDVIDRNYAWVEKLLSEGKEVKNIGAFVTNAIKKDLEGAQGALNPYAYDSPSEQNFIKEVLTNEWENLTDENKAEFIEHRFRQGVVANIYSQYKVRTGQRSVTESMMDIHDTNW
jgi:plasmid replication initiation protein